jgi:hypothetical protein
LSAVLPAGSLKLACQRRDFGDGHGVIEQLGDIVKEHKTKSGSLAGCAFQVPLFIDQEVGRAALRLKGESNGRRFFSAK